MVLLRQEQHVYRLIILPTRGAPTERDPQAVAGAINMSPSGAMKSESRSANHEARITNHEARITNHEARSTKHEARITNHEARIAKRESRSTKHEARITKRESRSTKHEARITKREARSAKNKALSTNMGVENFISDALHKPNDVIPYHVSRELAELYPDKTIVEGQNWSFDLETFVRDELCSIVADRHVYKHVSTDWEGSGKPQKEYINNAWLNVLWQGKLLELVIITFDSTLRHYWIVADDKATAMAFNNAVCEWSCEVRGEILVFQEGMFEKNKELFESIKHANLDKLILRGSLKQDVLKDFERFFAARELYDRYGIPWKRGALFIGPPGNGKTQTVKALVKELGNVCLYVRSFKSEFGTEQDNMSKVFKHARTTMPCLVILEDLDAMITNQNRAFFLNELDGFEVNTGVVVIATTNHPEKLDTAILDRPSRFDRKYYFNLPNEEERLAYLANWNKDLQPDLRVADEALPMIAAATEGFSFAYMKELMLSAMVQWMSEDGKTPMDKVLSQQVTTLRGQMSGPTNTTVVTTTRKWNFLKNAKKLII